MKAGPKVSVVVAVFNAGKSIRRTLESILSQSYDNKELLVIDGGSTDDTLEQIANFRDRIDCLVSERDKGIADAYNKGIRAASGDWIYFLNADDLFSSETTLADVFGSGDVAEDLIVGKVVSDRGRVFDGRFNWKLLIRNQVHHQAIFYRSKFLKSTPYNSQYRRYGHDHEHNILIWLKSVPARYIDKEIALWGSGGISDSANWKDYREEFSVRRNTLGLLGFPFNIFTLGRYAGKRLSALVRR